ncbi:hypothetical protein CPB83DRAFT_657711 [Crepidotus variabilis]|uniref:Secreted protein n=1 Tax=Crepidotus variabilis TaxID=179855 RepID=A0A9P6JJW5_9AGAR|nr:hypothetical protein CPB83DRAFT_657711 [Crepidotus variabilis]
MRFPRSLWALISLPANFCVEAVPWLHKTCAPMNRDLTRRSFRLLNNDGRCSHRRLGISQQFRLTIRTKALNSFSPTSHRTNLILVKAPIS